jgi:hypothetical protein
MKIKKHALPISYLIILGLSFFSLTEELYHRQPSAIVISKSGDYLIEHVRATGILNPLGDMSYLKITRISSPKKSYRTPLFRSSYLDMRPHENDQAIGITWIDFIKEKKAFEIGIPEWKEHWLNIFISDTPYAILPN